MAHRKHRWPGTVSVQHGCIGVEISEMRKLLNSSESQRVVQWEAQRRLLLRCQRAFEELRLDDVVKIPKALLGSSPELGTDVESLLDEDAQEMTENGVSPSKQDPPKKGNFRRRAAHAKRCAVRDVAGRVETLRSRSQQTAAKLQAVHARDEAFQIDMMEVEIKQRLADGKSGDLKSLNFADTALMASAQEASLNDTMRRIKCQRMDDYKKATSDMESREEQGDVSIEEALDIVSQLDTLSRCDTSVGDELSEPEMSDDDEVLNDLAARWDAKSTTAASESQVNEDIMFQQLLEVQEEENEEDNEVECRVTGNVEATPCPYHEPLHRRRYRIRPMERPNIQTLVPRPTEEDLDPKLAQEVDTKEISQVTEKVTSEEATPLEPAPAPKPKKATTKFKVQSVAMKQKARDLVGSMKRGVEQEIIEKKDLHPPSSSQISPPKSPARSRSPTPQPPGHTSPDAEKDAEPKSPKSTKSRKKKLKSVVSGVSGLGGLLSKKPKITLPDPPTSVTSELESEETLEAPQQEKTRSFDMPMALKFARLAGRTARQLKKHRDYSRKESTLDDEEALVDETFDDFDPESQLSAMDDEQESASQAQRQHSDDLVLDASVRLGLSPRPYPACPTFGLGRRLGGLSLSDHIACHSANPWLDAEIIEEPPDEEVNAVVPTVEEAEEPKKTFMSKTLPTMLLSRRARDAPRRATTGTSDPSMVEILPPKPVMEDAEMQTDPPPPPPEIKFEDAEVEASVLMDDQASQTITIEKPGMKVQSTQTERNQTGVDRDELSRRFMMRATKVSRRSTVGNADAETEKQEAQPRQPTVSSQPVQPAIEVNFSRHSHIEVVPSVDTTDHPEEDAPTASQHSAPLNFEKKKELGLTAPKAHRKKSSSRSMKSIFRGKDDDDEDEQKTPEQKTQPKKADAHESEDAEEVDLLGETPQQAQPVQTHSQAHQSSDSPKYDAKPSEGPASPRSPRSPASPRALSTSTLRQPPSNVRNARTPSPMPPDIQDDLDQMLCEVVDCEQQTEMIWEDVAEGVLSWLKYNLMQKQQAELYSSDWTISPIPGFDWDLNRRNDYLRGFEEFLKRVMCLEKPTKREQRRGLRNLYDEATQGLKSAASGDVSKMAPSASAHGSDMQKSSQKDLQVIVGTQNSEQQFPVGTNPITGNVHRGIVNKRGDEVKSEQSLPSMLGVEGMDILPRDFKGGSLFPSESPTQGMTGLTNLLSNVLGFKMHPEGLPGVNQDVYCLEHAARKFLMPVPGQLQNKTDEKTPVANTRISRELAEPLDMFSDINSPKAHEHQLPHISNINKDAALPLDAVRREKLAQQQSPSDTRDLNLSTQDFQGTSGGSSQVPSGLIERGDKAERLLKNIKQQGLGGADVVSKWLRQLDDADTKAAGALTEIAGTSQEDRKAFMSQANPVRRGLLAALPHSDAEPWVGTRIEGLAAKIAAAQAHDNVIARASVVSEALVNTLQALKQRRHAAGTLLRFGFARLRINARQAIRAEDQAFASGHASQVEPQQSSDYVPTPPARGWSKSQSKESSDIGGSMSQHGGRIGSQSRQRPGFAGRVFSIGGGNRGPHAPNQDAGRSEDANQISTPAIAGLGPASDNVELSRRSAAGASCKWRTGKPNAQRNTLQFAQKADAFIGAVAWSYTGKPAEPGANRKPRKLRGSSTSQKYTGDAADAPASQDQVDEEIVGRSVGHDSRRHMPLPTPDPTSTPDPTGPSFEGKASTPIFAVSPTPADRS
eukprot:gnl/MRDRNA2_/MRDRNA2_62085_c0_seq1.p1 gnl/MRDRNA2_/MRDRNA2_62085_c0~~gnl/MRDRNA2_/MRDRNA2_62085_c0_seq1.p1  ORF type:complete len:1736 (+),score=365.70 gnl/MRDRNA2_/MRDRNA2_62085_c0_seq1:3015-8222(+)